MFNANSHNIPAMNLAAPGPAGFPAPAIAKERAGWGKRLKKAGNFQIGRRVSPQDRIFLTRHFLTMFDAGLSWLESLQVAIEESNKPYLKRSLIKIYEHTKNGSSLSKSFARFPLIFNRYYIAMIQIGEKSGRLSESFKYLLANQEREYQLRTKIRNALIYPAAIVMVMIAIVIGLVFFIIPRIAAIYSEEQVALPWATRALISLSAFLGAYFWYLLLAVLVLVVLMKKIYAGKNGKKFFDKILVKLPIFGQLAKNIQLARLTRSLADLIKSGVSMNIALGVTADTMSISAYRDSIAQGVQSVQRGEPLSEVFKRHPGLYPPLLQQMSVVGERSGQLDSMCLRASEHYESIVINTAGNLVTLIEPLLLLITGLFVGGIAVAVLSPIWNFAMII